MADGKEKTVSILAYIFLIGVIWYFVDDSVRGKANAKYHVKQALNLAIISFVVTMVLSFIPIIGWILLPIVQLFFLVLWVMGLVRAMKQEKKTVPVVGGWAEKYLDF